MIAENHDPVMREIGNKLRAFRHKLALAINEKKIKQSVFGEMFGDWSERQISSYESGDVEIPARLLYSIWLTGNSLDTLFGEGPITDTGRQNARELYYKSKTARLEAMDQAELNRLETAIEEYHVKEGKNGAAKKPNAGHARKRSRSAAPPRKVKRRR